MHTIRWVISLFFLVTTTIGYGQEDATPHEQNTHYSLKMEYPKEALLKGVEGDVIITFDLDSTCAVHNIRQDIVLGYGCEEVMFDALCELEKRLKEDFNNSCELLIDNTLPAVFELEKDEVSYK